MIPSPEYQYLLHYKLSIPNFYLHQFHQCVQDPYRKFTKLHQLHLLFQ